MDNKKQLPPPFDIRHTRKHRYKKVFTKIDLWWGYNNVRIKKGDEWKAAFTILEGFFELTVMFFRLTNSPATFQAMMNEVLRDLINIGKVATFINNVIVRMNMEEGVRHGSHQSGSLQNGLRDEQTCGMILASAYMLHCLSAT